ncbi:MAG: DUF1298 domain-containing protein [Microthrixaceae bacterium]|nr:DUF1298 domain-containing protein [Microthrixaceae bacterium]
MAYEAHDDELMSGFESMMWDMERDPHLASTFSNITILDQAPDRAAFRARMSNALERVPRLRQRVEESSAPWQLPRWVDDDEIDLDYHLRWLDMGGSASRRDLYDLVAVLSRDPLDRGRPLWQFIVIEGLDDGRAAMLQRLHHTITDGEGGIRLSVEFLDFERNPVRRSGDGEGSKKTKRSKANFDTQSTSSDESDPSAPATTDGPSLFTQAREAVESVLGGTSKLYGTARSAGKQAMVGNRRSPLWTQRSLDRWYGTTTLNLEDVIKAAHDMDASVNDFFMAGAAAAAGRIHDLAGKPVDQLRASMPVSTRHDRSAGGNAFSPTQMLVPTGEMTPRERVTAIHDIIVELRQEKAIESMGRAANAVAAALPTTVILRSGQYLTRSVDFVCSNVRAAPFDLFIGGALMQANYPIGPIAGTAFNLTTMSYRGWLYLGLYVDTAAVEDPPQLLDVLNGCYDELLASAGLTRRLPEFD